MEALTRFGLSVLIASVVMTSGSGSLSAARIFSRPTRTRMRRAIEANVDSQLVRLDSFRLLLEGMFRELSVHGSSSARSTLLLASVLKITQSATAVRLLSEGICVEEVLSLGHTLVEVTVNSAYFQVAPESEVERFFRFHPETRPGLSLGSSSGSGFAASLARRAADLLSGAGHHDREASWSPKSVAERAAYADKQSHIPVMVPLVSRCYARGHAAVHGNVASLDTFIWSVDAMEAPRKENRLAGLIEALFGVNLCLLTECMYLNSLFHMGLDQAIDDAANAESSGVTHDLEASEGARELGAGRRRTGTE